MISKWIALAIAAMSFAVGFTLEMAHEDRHYALAIIMVVMVIIYAAIELGWGGGSDQSKGPDRWR